MTEKASTLTISEEPLMQLSVMVRSQDGAHHRRYGVADAGGNGSTCQTPAEHAHEQPVQNDVQHNAEFKGNDHQQRKILSCLLLLSLTDLAGNQGVRIDPPGHKHTIHRRIQI